MSTKREILEHPSRDELLAAVERFGLEVADQRAKAGFVEVVTGANGSYAQGHGWGRVEVALVSTTNVDNARVKPDGETP
jgi:hypothetical protein